MCGVSGKNFGKASGVQLTRETYAGTLPVAWSTLPLQTLDVSYNNIMGACHVLEPKVLLGSCTAGANAPVATQVLCRQPMGHC